MPACHGEGFGAARSGKDGRCVGRVEPRAPRRLPLSDPGDRFAVMERVETDAAAGALAARLNGSGRRKPIVVVTTPSGRADPWIDAVAIERELGDLAEVVLMPTGTFTWSFSDAMPSTTQVYGGAGRVYPTGLEWTSRPSISPLRFAFDETEGARATKLLIDDALGMAARAGLVGGGAQARRRRVEGVVKGVIAGRAIVELGLGGVASIAPALAVDSIAAERQFRDGQRVAGLLDAQTRWLDVRRSVLEPRQALAPYAVGDVVLAEVGDVAEATAELFLHPRQTVTITRDEITGNELDDLRVLLSRGEVVAARVTATGARWSLTMIDVDDDEEPVPAASLLPGGPPWLMPPSDEARMVAADQGEDESPAVAPPPLPARLAPELSVPAVPAAPSPPPPEPSAATAPAASARPTPTPRLLDRSRRFKDAAPAAVAPAASPAPDPAAAASVAPHPRADAAAALEVEVAFLKRENVGLTEEISLLRSERSRLSAQVERQKQQLQVQRTMLRKEKGSTSGVARPEFADSEQGFRYDVLTAWASRTPVGEQPSRPLPDYRIGPHFMSCLERLHGMKQAKVADVVVEIVTDRAKDIGGRELHQYRESDGGNAPGVRRTTDDALLWRVNLQTNSASARRLHYWVLPGGKIELWHVGTHDERPPLP